MNEHLQKPKIRLRYSGFINFSASIYSAITGLLFTTLITRNLPLQEVGLFRLISALISYFIIPVGIFGDWITRYRARGFYKASLTGIVNCLILSLTSTFLLIASTPYILPEIYTQRHLLLLTSMLLLLLALNRVTSASLRALMPHALGYGDYIFETIKVLAFILLLFSFKMYNISAALTAIAIAFLARNIFSLLLLREDIKSGDFDHKMLLRWYLISWIQLYMLLPPNITRLDNFLLNALLPNSKVILAFLQVLFTVGGIATYAIRFSDALYSKVLISSEVTEIRSSVEMILRFILMFDIPLILGSLILSKELLMIFGKEYVTVAGVLPLVMLLSTLSIISTFLGTSLRGIEKADIETTSPKILIRSTLVIVPTIDLISALLYLPLLVLSTLFFSENTLLVIFSLISSRIITSAFSTLTKYMLLKRSIGKLNIRRSFFNYLLASLIMCLLVFLIKNYTYPPTGLNESLRVREILILLSPYIISGAIIYVAVLLVLDHDFRSLTKLILRSIVKRLRQ